MSFALDDLSITVPCQRCGSISEKTIGWIKANRIYVCSCGAEIDLKSQYFADEIRKAEAVSKGLVSSTQTLGN